MIGREILREAGSFQGGESLRLWRRFDGGDLL